MSMALTCYIHGGGWVGVYEAYIWVILRTLRSNFLPTPAARYPCTCNLQLATITTRTRCYC